MCQFWFSFQNSIKTNRFFYYGLSIFLIILYHANSFGFHSPVFMPFSAGYIGVDIFMFFSAYGCCYSFEKNDLITFYKRRVKRIYPIYMLFTIVVSVVYAVGGGKMSPFDLLSVFSLLWYFDVGGIYVEWYMTSILLLYMAFPIFYYLADKLKLLGLVALIVLCILLLLYGDFEWWHKALIGRLPMYYVGCLFYLNTISKSRDSQGYFFIYLFMILVVSLAYIIINQIQGFISVDMLAPFLIIIMFLFSLVMMRIKWLYSFICACGRYSFQIFAANAMTLVVLNHTDLDLLSSYIVYFVLTLSLIPAFIYYDKFAERVMLKLHL